jgi:sterol desaturase/sphingolipid hydroxylase (fatty acid hydroxylase superfamily)
VRPLLEAPWLQGILDQATPYALAVNVPYALAWAAVMAEVAWLARRAGPARSRVLRSAATATTMAAGALVVGVLYTAVFRFLWETVALLRWEAAARFWQDNLMVGALVTFVAWDLSGWLYHLIGHKTRIGWAAHQSHHSGPDYDATLGLRQSWAPFHGLVHHPLLALAGFDLRVVIVCAAVSNCWQVLEHTSLPIRFPGWIEAVVMTPAAHRHHHGRDGGLVNVGPFFTVWDRLAGTWVAPDVPAPMAYGPARPAPANPIAVELAGWMELAGHLRPSRRRPAPGAGVRPVGLRAGD